MRNAAAQLILVGLALVTLTGCNSVGPDTIPRDRFSYSDAIAESWQDEMLLNLVKIRYGDTPVFLEVASVISQYSLEGELSADASFSDGFLGNTQGIGGRARYTDRPTITYAPLTGARFTRSLLRPIPVGSVLELIESGWPADLVMRLMVESINGQRNRSGAAVIAYPGDPEFFEICRLMRTIQRTRGVGMRTKPDDDSIGAFIFPEMGTTDIEDERLRLRTLLSIDPTTNRFDVVQSSIQQNNAEIAIRTRSMFMILSDLAATIDIPQHHIDEGRSTNPFGDMEMTDDLPQFRTAIRSSEEEPDDAFVKVRYHDYWFYIPDTDIASKRGFTLLMILFSLADSDVQDATPIITVPTG